MTPFFSVIMPSYLGDYPGCATAREMKFRRAVTSVTNQTEQEWELIIVADGCADTMRIVEEEVTDPRITAIEVEKQPLWSPGVRNAGILAAEGKYIIYLDTDDQYEPDHLYQVRTGLEAHGLPTWAWMDDNVWDVRRKSYRPRLCDITRRFQHGTSNYVHRRDTDLLWPDGGYDHDLKFSKRLMDLGEAPKLEACGYLVGHIPKRYDV